MFGEIQNKHGEKIDYTYHPGNGESKVLVVIGHGVTGNKDRPFVKKLADGIESAGISVLRISFTGNGDSGGDFRDCTISKEVEDLTAVLEIVSGNRKVVYAGHSMGGAVGVLAASNDDRIGHLISLSGMVHTAKFSKVEFGDQIPDEGFMWEEEDCPLSSAYVNDMNTISSVLEKGSEIKVPWLLVHGTEDDVVPIEETHEIFKKANEPKKRVVIDGADHVFSSEEASAEMVEAVVTWLKEFFGRIN
jgi:alpha-beta hydrolase superfamily lysophospholipase